MITSPHNEKLKEIRKLSRAGVSATGRAGRGGGGGSARRGRRRRLGTDRSSRCAGERLPGIEVEAKLLDGVSELASGTRTLAVYEERWAPELAGALVVYLHGVADPGNVGTVLRSAQAFGASAVALGPGSADPYGPKAVRASMGAIFSVPVARVDGTDALPGNPDRARCRRAAVARGRLG